uniref:Uncharacterized protein n=1 Tax=Mola mola TaxID=94237 RepID=A0A3Q3W2T1_MOLML
MASASVVGQHPGLHRLDSEPQLLFLKLSSAKKKIPLPRKSSWEKMIGLPLERLTQGRTGVVRLARTEPPRMEAWSIFPRRTDPRMRAERGEGHRFEAKPVTQDWCDACSRQITAQALKCQNCSYTCHLECERKVQLDCNQRGKETEQTPFPRRQCTATAPQQKAPDGSFTGFIKVHLRLSRPVTVVEALGSEGASRQAEGCGQATTECRGGTDCEPSDKRTSFYLPSDCVTQLHVSSATTTREVIQGLLKKFMVLDNPGKFALYRQAHRDGQDLFQKLPLCECPLLLRLLAGPDPQLLRFVLKEKETGEVEWHAFSVPELQNFLMILEKEEAERVRAVEEKYSLHRQKLQQAIEQYDS